MWLEKLPAKNDCGKDDEANKNIFCLFQSYTETSFHNIIGVIKFNPPIDLRAEGISTFGCIFNLAEDSQNVIVSGSSKIGTFPKASSHLEREYEGKITLQIQEYSHFHTIYNRVEVGKYSVLFVQEHPPIVLDKKTGKEVAYLDKEIKMLQQSLGTKGLDMFSKWAEVDAEKMLYYIDNKGFLRKVDIFGQLDYGVIVPKEVPPAQTEKEKRKNESLFSVQQDITILARDPKIRILNSRIICGGVDDFILVDSSYITLSKEGQVKLADKSLFTLNGKDDKKKSISNWPVMCKVSNKYAMVVGETDQMNTFLLLDLCHDDERKKIPLLSQVSIDIGPQTKLRDDSIGKLKPLRFICSFQSGGFLVLAVRHCGLVDLLAISKKTLFVVEKGFQVAKRNTDVIFSVLPRKKCWLLSGYNWARKLTLNYIFF